MAQEQAPEKDEIGLWWALREPWSLLALGLAIATILVYAFGGA